jgi:iron complex transport system substrate-binding protein
MRTLSRGAGLAAALAAALLGSGAAAAIAAPAGPAAAPKRIVALTPFSANTLADLGVRPVAIGQSLGGRGRFSPRLRRVRMLPLAHPNGPNMEQLAALEPQLVLSSPTWRRGARIMRGLDIRVEEAEPRRVSEVPEQVRRIGRLVGRRRAAARLAARIEREVAAATRGIESRPRVMLILGVGRTPFVFLPNSWGGDLLRRAGARLVTAGAEAPGGFARISDESVVAEDPDVIVGVPHANPDDLDGIRQYMESNETWQLTSAGQNDRIYISNDDTLLQPDTNVAGTIARVRARFLDNR